MRVIHIWLRIILLPIYSLTQRLSCSTTSIPLKNLDKDVQSSVVVFLVAVPLCLGAGDRQELTKYSAYIYYPIDHMEVTTRKKQSD